MYIASISILLAQLICDEVNLSTLCDVIRSIPILGIILNNGFLFDSNLGIVAGSLTARDIGVIDSTPFDSRSFPAPKVPNLDIPDGLRRLEEVEGKVELGRRLTMFGPNNAALDSLFDRKISDLYGTSTSVEMYFANLPVYNNGVMSTGITNIETTDMSVFLLHTRAGNIALAQIIALHILYGEFSRNELYSGCNKSFDSIIGQPVFPTCAFNAQLVLGEGNDAAPFPELDSGFEALASNGILYEVDQVILPDPMPRPIVPDGGAIILVNSALLNALGEPYNNLEFVLRTGPIFLTPAPSSLPATAPPVSRS